MMIESMKKKAMDNIEHRCKMSEFYNEGLKDGFTEGYEQAQADMKGILAKYNIMPPKEKELKPAIRFLHQSQEKLLNKIVEETTEVVDAFNDGEPRERIAEEVADVQEACETFLAKLGYSEDGRKEVRMKVIDKNSKRGYFKPKEGSFGD